MDARVSHVCTNCAGPGSVNCIHFCLSAHFCVFAYPSRRQAVLFAGWEVDMCVWLPQQSWLCFIATVHRYVYPPCYVASSIAELGLQGRGLLAGVQVFCLRILFPFN